MELVEYTKECLVDNELAILDIFEDYGEGDPTLLHDGMLRSQHGFLLVYSLTDRSSFTKIRFFHRRVERVKDSREIPMILVGTNSDSLTERQVSLRGLLQSRSKTTYGRPTRTSA